MSVATAYLLRRNLSNIGAILFACGGMLIKQSFRYAALSVLRQLQFTKEFFSYERIGDSSCIFSFPFASICQNFFEDFAKSKLEIVCKLPWRSPLKNQLSLYSGQESKYPSLDLTPVGPFPLSMSFSTKFHY